MLNGVSSILFSGGSSLSSPSSRFAALDHFVAGPENRLACEAAQRVLLEDHAYNPLVITGPARSGKSHLALGLSGAWSRRYPETAALVLTAAEFSQQFGRAVQDGDVARLRETYRTSKFMVVEDLADLAGKGAAQQELLYVVDDLLDRDVQILATCREPLVRMTMLLPGLRSRLMAGLEVPLAWPEVVARAQIIEELAAARDTQIMKSASRALAEAITGSVPDLLGALVALESTRTSSAGPITLVEVESYLLHSQPRVGHGLHGLSMLAARHFGLKLADLKSPSRERSVVQARSVAMYLARQSSGKTLVEIGRFFGGRDHSTVLHSCRQIERLIPGHAETRLAVESLQAELTRGTPLRDPVHCGNTVRPMSARSEKARAGGLGEGPSVGFDRIPTP